jgi:hypothetical protein
VTLGAPTTGTVIVTDPGPVGVPQDLTDLRDAITDQLPEAILLVSGQGEGTIAVVQLDPSSSDASNFPSSVMLGFTTTSDYDVLSTGGTYPPFLTTVSHVGILEEYRFYVEEAYESNGGDLTPLLRRDRYYPNTDTEHQEAGGGLADNVLDVQIAQGFDADGDGTVTEEDPPDESDEWMGNHAADTPIVGPLFHLRISTVAQTDRRTRNYFAPAIVAVEDRSYAEPTMPTNETERLARMFRRRVLVSSIDLRNLF